MSKNIQTVLDILNDEVRGDIQSALAKLDSDYSMTWIYRSPKTGTLFPTTQKNIGEELQEAYEIKDRHYDIKNVAENAEKNVVMIELIESYPDPKTKQIYRTPLVLVLEMKDGKIKTGRHYCDPDLSCLELSKKDVEKAFR